MHERPVADKGVADLRAPSSVEAKQADIRKELESLAGLFATGQSLDRNLIYAKLQLVDQMISDFLP